MLQSYKKYLNPATFFAIILPQNAKFFGQLFTKPSNTFSVAFQKVLRGFVANNPSYCLLHIAAKKKCVTEV